jgi:hypothetical protein
MPQEKREECIAHLLLDNVMRSDPLFFWERSLYDAFLTLVSGSTVFPVEHG